MSHRRVRRLRGLLKKPALRRSEGAFVAEGLDVIGVALDAGAPLEGLYLASEGRRSPEVEALRQAAVAVGVRCFELAPGVLQKVSGTVTPQPVLAVVARNEAPLAVVEGASLVVVCVDLQDPGNAGTVLRTADACGLDAVVFCGQAVDPFNPKAVRASAGSIFHVPVIWERSVDEVLEVLGGAGLRRLATLPHGGEDYDRCDWSVPSAIVVGNEAGGLSESLLGAVEGAVSIPMEGRAESLNVAMACAVVCFEARRQKRRDFSAAAAAHSTMPSMRGGAR